MSPGIGPRNSRSRNTNNRTFAQNANPWTSRGSSNHGLYIAATFGITLSKS
ncbi:hypothetical protein [Mycobacterium kansasii]|uniref:hypothetical protein n=1 Tax=Mycobacterium kansasii TaxID=1768 RepID=UPI001E3BD1BF|nr:hypothetical protein [Mycobacterium kansasii]